MKVTVFRFLCLFLMSFCIRAFACHTDPSSYTATPGTIAVQRDLPVGSILYTGTLGTLIYPFATDGNESCTTVLTEVYSQTASTLDDVYQTNVSGIGIQFAGSDNDGYHVASSDGVTGITFNHAREIFYAGYIYLIKTGDITPGTVNSGLVGRFMLKDASTGSLGAGELDFNIDATQITQLACSMTSGASLSFPIGAVPADQFTSVGTVSQQTNTQNLGVNCDAGANINVTLVGVQNPETSDPSVLALTSGEGVATGVGVQLLYNDTPLKLNTLLNLKTSAGGQESFPITARYIQTKDKVTPGAANATATLNITYQ